MIYKNYIENKRLSNTLILIHNIDSMSIDYRSCETVALNGPQITVALNGPQITVALNGQQITVALNGPQIIVALNGPQISVALNGPQITVALNGPQITVALNGPQITVALNGPQISVALNVLIFIFIFCGLQWNIRLPLKENYATQCHTMPVLSEINV